MNKPVIILGAGGHASVLADILLKQGREILSIIAPDVPTKRVIFNGLDHWFDDGFLKKISPDHIELVNGIGSLPKTENIRSKLFHQYKSYGFNFATVIADEAIVSKYVQLGEGVQILHRAVIQIGSCIGNNSIINTGAIIDHDCFIGADTHISPGATLSGSVNCGSRVHIGTGSNVIQGINIGDDCVVAAGALVRQNIEPNHIVYSARGFLCPIN